MISFLSKMCSGSMFWFASMCFILTLKHKRPYILLQFKKLKLSKCFKICATISLKLLYLQHFLYVFVTASKWMPVENLMKNINSKPFYFWSQGVQYVSLNTFPRICNRFKMANRWSFQKKKNTFFPIYNCRHLKIAEKVKI